MILDKAKALVAAAVAFGATWAATKFGFELSPEIQGTIVGIITSLFVYFTPNKE